MNNDLIARLCSGEDVPASEIVTALREQEPNPADYDACDEHEHAYPRHGFCPYCRIVELEADRDKWQSKAHHQNQDNLILQARIAELEAENFQLDHEAEKWAGRYDKATLSIKRLDAALADIEQRKSTRLYKSGDPEKAYLDVCEIARKARAGD